MTVSKAINKAHYFITFPIIVIIIASNTIASQVASSQSSGYYNDLIGIGIGILIAWIYRSFAVSKWRIWAYQNVKHIHQLELKATQQNIIWPKDSFISKTEIVLPADKPILQNLQKRFSEPDHFAIITSLPAQTTYYFQSSHLIQVIFKYLIITAIVATLYVYNKIGLILSLGIFIGIIMTPLFHAIKNIRNKQIQLTIDNTGITFKDQFRVSWNTVERFYFKNATIDNLAAKILVVEYKTPDANALKIATQNLMNISSDDSQIIEVLHSYKRSSQG